MRENTAVVNIIPLLLLTILVLLFEAPMVDICNLNGKPKVGSMAMSRAGTSGKASRALGQAAQAAVTGSTANGPENLRTLFK